MRMLYRHPLSWVCLSVLFVNPISSAIESSGLDSKRPNIILILADDLRFEDVSSYGNTKVPTTNIDRRVASFGGFRCTI